MAENVAASVSKGDRVIVVGRISKHDFTTTGGEQRTKTYVVATEVAMSCRFAQMEVNRG
jgi:single-strand DNA-binding protein